MWRGLLVVPGFAAAAHADVLDRSFEPPSAAPLIEPMGPPTETVTSNYRAETLTADALSIGLTFTVYIDMSDRHEAELAPMFALGLLGSAFATPIIHAIHGHGMRGIGSYLVRSSLGTLGAVIAASTERCKGDLDFLCGIDRAPAGFAIGIAAAALFDAAFLTSETREAPIHTAWAPVITPHAGGAEVGFAASF